MDLKAGKVFVVESDDGLRAQIVKVLSDAGYELSTDALAGMIAVLAFAPDVVVLGADPPQLDCCDLLSEIKGSESTRNIRVLMLSPGGSGERTRGMDLGADDVLSLPFDPHELLSRVRAQIHAKGDIENLQKRLRLAETNRKESQQVAAAVDKGRRTLRVGFLATMTALAVVSLVFFFLYRRTQEQNTRVYTAVTRLQSSVLTQDQLIQRSRQTQSGASAAANAETLELQKKRADLKSKLAASNAENASALRSELNTVQGRLQKLETEGTFAQAIIQSYEPSVCLIHVLVAFRDRATGLRLRYAGFTINGTPTTDEHNNPLLSLTGSGPEVHLDVFGTGFLVSASGEILTNHHVVEPWWQNDDLKEMTDQGLEPVATEMTAYFPGVAHGISINTEKISSAADVALVRGNVSGLGIKEVALADRANSAMSGGAVVLLGYPTAVDAILARAGEETVRSIVAASNGDPQKVMQELAARKLIRPITTQGHIGDVLSDKIIYDAQTTSGGSGGPLFSNQGKVIGINFAMVREFGGSNFAIPINYGKSLLRP
ncbi:MAG TPA: trypsin-like peptidase domain-containing protein [Terriglobales bacterium]|jgi:DNA-binding response OmpR family regulator|nr:trypsin-like peptidase domain-containing protein [Terriglobales bacterium]